MGYAVSGIDGTVKVTPTGGTTTDMNVDSYSIDVEVGDINTMTTADAGWDDSIDGPKKVTGSFDFFWDPTRSPFSALVGMTPGSGNYPSLTLRVDASNNYAGISRVTKLSLKSATKDAKKFTASFVSKGQWIVPTAGA